MIHPQMRVPISPLYMTFHVETLEDLFCISPSSLSQLIDRHHLFVPQTLTEPLASATHCVYWGLSRCHHGGLSSQIGHFSCLFPILSKHVYFTPFTCSLHSSVFILEIFLPGNISPRKLATNCFQSSFLPFLEISPCHRVAGVSFHPNQDSPNFSVSFPIVRGITLSLPFT